MKTLASDSISFDRISTREELEQVLHLLSDTDISQGGGIDVSAETADSLPKDWLTELEEAGTEKASESREKGLMALLLQMDGPTN